MINEHKIYNKAPMSREEVLLQSLYQFYKNIKHITKIIPIVTGDSNISLRSMDWFVTNYSKKFNIIYNVTINGESIRFNVYHNYKNELKSVGKRFFDPFCRKNKKNIANKIIFNYDTETGGSILTTIGQLNFFRWAVKYNVIEYVENNIDHINSDMNSHHYKKKNGDKIKSNKKIDKSTMSTMVNFNNSTVVN